MSDRKLVSLCVGLLVFAVFATLLLTSCNEQRDFNKVDVITTTKPVTEPVTYVYSDLEIFGTRMGMSLEETQQALGENIEIRFSDLGQVYFAVGRKNLDFVNEGLEAAVYFIYDTDARLCEIQYVSTNDTGFVVKEAVEKFDSLYGRHASIKDEEKTNYIWFKDGDYMAITTFADGQNSVSYFSKAYFEQTKPEYVAAYNGEGE